MVYRRRLQEERAVDGVRIIVYELRWVDGERTYEVVDTDTQETLPGGDDLLKVPSDQEIAELLREGQDIS
jgi:hypothetical protein